MTATIMEFVETSVLSRITDTLRHASRLASLKAQIRSERDQLMNLTDRELRDIGITREDAQREAYRGYDDIPNHRLRNCQAPDRDR